MVALGDYDVVSPTEAVARLSDPRFGPSYGGRDAAGGRGPMRDRRRRGVRHGVAPAPSDEPTVPATPAAGSPLAWPVQHVTHRVRAARSRAHHAARRRSVLVPTYELADADGATWTVIAVADDDLDFSS